MEEQQKVVPYYLRPNELHKKMNEKMGQLLPELENNQLILTPMARNKWFKPTDTLDTGEPCFIPAASDIKTGVSDYVWMPKRKELPAGYYHLRTQEAYIQLYTLIRQRKVPLYQRVFQRRKEDFKLHRKVEKLFYLRLNAEVPNDIQAARMHLLNIQADSGKNAAFGKAAYLPVLTFSLISF